MTAVLTRPSPATAPSVQAPTPPQRPDVVVRADAPPGSPPPVDVVDLWGMQSFPASDPPSNW